MIGQLTGKEYTELLQGEGAYIAKPRAEGLVQDWSKNRSKRPTIFYLRN
jgi:hypothetical protein